jgi:hypothetical protein
VLAEVVSTEKVSTDVCKTRGLGSGTEALWCLEFNGTSAVVT